MSKLILSDSDIKQAVVQYYEDHKTELYERYDFENIELRYVINHSEDVRNTFTEESFAQFSIEVEERKS